MEENLNKDIILELTKPTLVVGQDAAEVTLEPEIEAVPLPGNPLCADAQMDESLGHHVVHEPKFESKEQVRIATREVGLSSTNYAEPIGSEDGPTCSAQPPESGSKPHYRVSFIGHHLFGSSQWIRNIPYKNRTK